VKPQTAEMPVPLEEVVGAAVFKAEVEAWAKRIGVRPKEIRVRPMKRKWASCSSHGRLTFNSEILREPARFRAEAIVHELLHMKVPNHGRLFRALLRTHLASLSGPVVFGSD
jgi:hypothetical protein